MIDKFTQEVIDCSGFIGFKGGAYGWGRSVTGEGRGRFYTIISKFFLCSDFGIPLVILINKRYNIICQDLKTLLGKVSVG